MKLALTGTTGNLGSRVLSSLLTLNLIPASDLVICTSNPSKLKSQLPPSATNIAIRHGDYAHPSTLRSSFAGADVLFLVSIPSPSLERWTHHKSAIDAARAAGVQCIVYASLMFGGETGLESVAGVQAAHVRTIEYLERVREEARNGGGDDVFDFVVVREGIYAESWWLYAGFQAKVFQKADEGKSDVMEWVIADDGPVAWVGWDELAEGTARILEHWEDHKGQTLRLTGPRATTLKEVAGLVEEVTGRKVDVRVVGREEAARWHKEKGSVPEDQF